MQGMVALGALSYLLELDGQKSVADHYDQTNRKFINYFLGHAKVSNSLVLIKSLICPNCYSNILLLCHIQFTQNATDDHYHLQYDLPNTTWSLKYNLLYQV